MRQKQPASGTATTCVQIIEIDAEDFSNGDKQIVVFGGVHVRPRDKLKINNRYGTHHLIAGNVNHRVKMGSLVDLIYPKPRPHRVHKKVSV